MKYQVFGILWTVFNLALMLVMGIVGIYLLWLVIKALRVYINSHEVRVEKKATRKSLAEALRENRVRCKMTQEFVSETIGVSRQAVSKWENGETVPNTETLKLLSQLFDVSINTLLGSPRTMVCQCCGMPLDDSTLSKGPDGAFNEDYCKWCYADGQFAYPTKASLLDYLMAHMPNPDNAPAAVCRAQFDTYLSRLKHWKEEE